MIKNVYRKPCLMAFISFLFLFSANIFSKNNPNEINDSINIVAKNGMLRTILTSSNIFSNNVSCDLAKNIKDSEQILLKNSKSPASDSSVYLLHLSKEINEKCLAMSSFKKSIVPIISIGDGKLSATVDQDYDITKNPQLLRVNLVNLENEYLNKLKNCSIKASVFVGENRDVNAITHKLECQLSGFNVSFRLMSSFSVKNAISCVKSIEYLPEFIQPCKKMMLSKNKKISLTLENDLEDALSQFEVSKT